MWPKCTRSGLAGFLFLTLTALSAFGQEGVRDLPALQLFDPADIRPYGDWEAPKEGFFFTFDGIWWTISAPKKTSIGEPGAINPVFYGPTTNDEVNQGNNFDTGNFRAKQTGGDRMELGYTGEHNGFLIDSFELNGQTQHIYGQNVSMVFIDPGFGPTGTNHLLQGDVGGGVTANVPITFATMALMNRTQTNGIEFLYTYRQHLTHNGGQIQWMVGARYLRFDDEFFVDATGGNLADSAWDTMAKNRIWGPEIGVRWLKQFGRVSLSSEGRFMAGVNNQSIQQYGEIASLLTGTSNNPSPLPTLLHATTFDHSAELTEFSPLGEFRIEGHVQLTKLISFKAGWTGIVMGGMARSADMVLYNMNGDTGVPLGIVTDNNRAVVFMQGINIGVELNR